MTIKGREWRLSLTVIVGNRLNAVLTVFFTQADNR